MARSTQTQRSNGRTQTYGSRRSQPGPSQSHTQRNGFQPTNEEEEDDDEDDEDANMDVDSGAEGEITRKAKALVRLALFNERKRVPLRRDDINKKVMGDNTRQYKLVFAAAQHILQDTFGMELAELMTRVEREQHQGGLVEERNGENSTGLKKKAAGSGPKGYILRSTLHDSVLEQAVKVDDDLLAAESEDNPDAGEHAFQPAGTILSWSTSDQINGLGLTYVVLSLILVSSGSLKHFELKKYLTTMKIPLTSEMDFAPHDINNSMTVENFLSNLVKQGMLDCVQMGAGGRPQATQKRKSVGGDIDSGSDIEWRWGSRAYSEVGERAIAEFVANFMAIHMMQTAETRGERSGQRELEKVQESMMKDITRAAGGELAEVR